LETLVYGEVLLDVGHDLSSSFPMAYLSANVARALLAGQLWISLM
jgi:hypothetical protein